MKSVEHRRLHPFDIAEETEKRKNRPGLTDFTSCKIHYFTIKNSKSIKTCTVFKPLVLICKDVTCACGLALRGETNKMY